MEEIEIKKEVFKKRKEKYMEEASLQYEKVYLELKLKIMEKNKEKLRPLIKKHNNKVIDYFEKRLSEEVNKAERQGKNFKTPEYVKLVKDFWDRLYIFE
ncbi:MAG: hypothetical protein ACFFAT_15540 [Promethearchaeota archaeon]